MSMSNALSALEGALGMQPYPSEEETLLKSSPLYYQGFYLNDLTDRAILADKLQEEGRDEEECLCRMDIPIGHNKRTNKIEPRADSFTTFYLNEAIQMNETTRDLCLDVDDLDPTTRLHIVKECWDFFKRWQSVITDVTRCGRHFFLCRNGRPNRFYGCTKTGPPHVWLDMEHAASYYGWFSVYLHDDGKVHGVWEDDLPVYSRE